MINLFVVLRRIMRDADPYFNHFTVTTVEAIQKLIQNECGMKIYNRARLYVCGLCVTMASTADLKHHHRHDVNDRTTSIENISSTAKVCQGSIASGGEVWQDNEP